MASFLPPSVRVLENCRVAPSDDGLPPLGEASLPLTFFDIFWVGMHPVQRLFFYPCPVTTDHFVASALPRLKRSLSVTLRRYYPLAGRLRYTPGSDKFELYCTGGDSVAFTLAECADGDFHQLAGDQPRGIDTFRPLVPDIPAAADADANGSGPWALMALQVTVFPGAGLCVGVSIRHAACDGSGFTRFVKSWASACRSSEDAAFQAGEIPIIDRTLLPDPTGLYTIFWNGMKRLMGDQWFSLSETDGADVVRSTFLLRRAHIDKLRRLASESRPAPFRYSSFVLTCAYVWVCLLKAGKQPAQTGEDAYFFFAVDCRRRLRPPLPATYFGNCLGPCFVDARRRDLVGEGGIGCAAAAIAESIARLEEDGVLRGAEEWLTKVAERAPGRPLSIAGSPKFGVYEVDFGWGRPAKVEVVGIEETGAMALAESREEEGAIEIGLALPAPVIARFASLFTAGLEDFGNGALQ